jgi:hypothetical protein
MSCSIGVRSARWGFGLVVLAASVCSAAASAAPERVVLDHSVHSPRDPAVVIKLPAAARYLGADRFVLTQSDLGPFDDCELHAFVVSDAPPRVQALYWVQFEAYLPDHPALHHTYDSKRHLMLGGVDFLVDTWVASGSAVATPGSDQAHLEALLAAHGFRQQDSMSVRLVHLDATRRKELMIIYSEDLAPTGYTAADLKPRSDAHGRWGALEKELIARAAQSVSITRLSPERVAP